MALQNRYGEFKDFDPNKMVTAELAVVVSGDPASPTGRTMYVCFAPGVVKRITTYEDFENELQNTTEEIRKEFTEDIQTAIENSIAATTAANAATEAAQTATEAANEAAEAAMNYVLGDVSEKTVTFETATQSAGIESGDSLTVAFGKLAKFCSDLDQHAFNPLANNLTTNTAGYGMDARQGPVITGIIDDLRETSLVPRGYYNDKDLDSLFTPGVYVCVNCSHAPTTSWGTVIVFKGGTGSFVQIFCSENAVYYIRHYYISATSKWSDWDNLVKKSDLITMSTFTDQWVPGFLIKGYGFCIQIPRNSKNQILTMTIIEIYSDNVWKTPTSFQVIQRPNCWNIVCSEAGLGLAYGNVYLAKINGKIE